MCNVYVAIQGGRGRRGGRRTLRNSVWAMRRGGGSKNGGAGKEPCGVCVCDTWQNFIARGVAPRACVRVQARVLRRRICTYSNIHAYPLCSQLCNPTGSTEPLCALLRHTHTHKKHNHTSTCTSTSHSPSLGADMRWGSAPHSTSEAHEGSRPRL